MLLSLAEHLGSYTVLHTHASLSCFPFVHFFSRFVSKRNFFVLGFSCEWRSLSLPVYIFDLAFCATLALLWTKNMRTEHRANVSLQQNDNRQDWDRLWRLNTSTQSETFISSSLVRRQPEKRFIHISTLSISVGCVCVRTRILLFIVSHVEMIEIDIRIGICHDARAFIYPNWTSPRGQTWNKRIVRLPLV